MLITLAKQKKFGFAQKTVSSKHPRCFNFFPKRKRVSFNLPCIKAHQWQSEDREQLLGQGQGQHLPLPAASGVPNQQKRGHST